MNTVQVMCFLKAAEVENFTKAAEQLYMAQPALSRNIAALEQELDVQLFIRERKSVRLSAAGKICFEGFQQMISDYQTMLDQAQAAQRNISGELLIGTADGQLIGDAYGTVFNRMFQEYPHLTVKISFYSLDRLRKALFHGGIDVALITKAEVEDAEDEIEYIEVRHCETRLVVPVNHPKARQPNVSLADFKDETFLILNTKESQNVLNKNKKNIKGVDGLKFKEVPDIGTLAFWLESGLGISMLNNWHSLKNSPNLAFIKIPEVESVTETAAWNKNNTNPAIRIFLHFLQQFDFD